MRISDWSSDVCSSDLSANEEVEGVTDQFVVGERAAAYFGLDAVADEIVARVAPAIGDDFAHITGDVAHRIAHRVQIRFVQQVMLPCHEPGGVLMRKVDEVEEDRHREGKGEVPDEVALALVLEAGNMVPGGLTHL